MEKDGNSFTLECLNSSRDPENFFQISPQDYLRSENHGRIKAVYHSHIKEHSFSEYDKFVSISHKMPFILYCLANNSFQFFDPEMSNLGKYLGRKFDYSKNNCSTLIRDFYTEELDKKLGNYISSPSRFDEDVRGIEKTLEAENFQQVPANEPYKKYDILAMKKRNQNFISHLALYMGKDLILHQPMNAASKIESYSEFYKKLTLKTFRHKSLL
jgi:proteasome lid subunit RPN8/RPN11